MKKKSISEQCCSTARALDVIGDQWALVLLRDAFYGLTRFSEFANQSNIPKTTLSQRLELLTTNGILRKESISTLGERYQYKLTEKGHALYPVIVAIMQWGDEWISGNENKPIQLVDRKRKRPLKKIVVEDEKGKPLSARDVTFFAGPGADKSVAAFVERRGETIAK